MKARIKRVISYAAAAAVVAGSLSVPQISPEHGAVMASAAASGTNVLEYLDRGISAVNTGSGMLVSWRWLANDDDNAVFNLYRDGTLIYTSDGSKATC